MRWLHMTIIALFVAITIIFVAQNSQAVAVAFLGFSVRAPMALLAVIIYLLGMATGGSLLALLRRSIAGAGRRAHA